MILTMMMMMLIFFENCIKLYKEKTYYQNKKVFLQWCILIRSSIWFPLQWRVICSETHRITWLFLRWRLIRDKIIVWENYFCINTCFFKKIVFYENCFYATSCLQINWTHGKFIFMLMNSCPKINLSAWGCLFCINSWFYYFYSDVSL